MSATRAAAPTRQILEQWGFRINETGAEFWGLLDTQYRGANSTSRAEIEQRAQKVIEDAERLGFTATCTLLRRRHLTTTWSRLLPAEEVDS